MDNFLITLLLLAIGYVVGLVQGLQQTKLKAAVKALLEQPASAPTARVGGTQGSYKKVENITADTRPAGKATGVVVPKSPKRLDVEANAELRKAAEDWRIDIK